LELDGSVVQLQDFLRKRERRALEGAGDADKIMVHYRFDAVPAAARIAFPGTYDGSMFEKPAHKRLFEQAAQQRKQREEQLATWQQEHRSDGGARQEGSTAVEEVQQRGREIIVVGVARHPHHRQAYIIAGTYKAKNDGKSEPAAIRVDKHTILLNHQGERVIPVMLENLHEGEHICVEGRKSKRGVIDAVCVMM
jgi:hypothetical protein